MRVLSSGERVPVAHRPAAGPQRLTRARSLSASCPRDRRDACVTPITLRPLLAPTVTATPLTAPIGVAVDATITASGWPIPSIAVENLPAGLTLVDNRDGTARVTGIPTAAGSFTPIVVAENTTGTTRTPWAIDVTEAPAFTSTAFEQIATAAVELLAEPAPPAGTARLALPTLIPRASTAPPR